MVYDVAPLIAVIWYSPLIVSPPTEVAPVNVTKSPLEYPPAESATVTILDPDTVVKGLVSVTSARTGVMS